MLRSMHQTAIAAAVVLELYCHQAPDMDRLRRRAAGGRAADLSELCSRLASPVLSLDVSSHGATGRGRHPSIRPPLRSAPLRPTRDASIEAVREGQ